MNAHVGDRALLGYEGTPQMYVLVIRASELGEMLMTHSQTYGVDRPNEPFLQRPLNHLKHIKTHKEKGLLLFATSLATQAAHYCTT